MKDRVRHVQQTFSFMFADGFEQAFERAGSPEVGVDIRHRNALVHATVTRDRISRDAERDRLVTLIESVRFEAKQVQH